MKRNILLILGLSLIMTTMSGCMGGNKVFDNMVPQDMGEFSDKSIQTQLQWVLKK